MAWLFRPLLQTADNDIYPGCLVSSGEFRLLVIWISDESKMQFPVAICDFADTAIPPHVGITSLVDCIKAMQKINSELRLTAEERQTLCGVFIVPESLQPAAAAAHFFCLLLPSIASRAYRHFQHKCKESHEDAEDLSHLLVTKILTAIKVRMPTGNVGAWIARIRSNLYLDFLRSRRHHRLAMTRIESTWRAMRR